MHSRKDTCLCSAGLSTDPDSFYLVFLSFSQDLTSPTWSSRFTSLQEGKRTGNGGQTISFGGNVAEVVYSTSLYIYLART